MEVVEKTIGTCRRWNRKKLICHVITLLIQSIETQFFIVWGLIVIIQHHLNKQSAGQSIPQRVGRELRLLPAPALRTLAMSEEEWATHLSARPVSWARTFNWKAYSQWKTFLKGWDLALCQPWVSEQLPLLGTNSWLKRSKPVKNV